jgi:hypothetical protein
MFENRVLRRIFGPKREEVARYWRRLHNEELHKLKPKPTNQGDEMGGVCSTHGPGTIFTLIVGYPERENNLGELITDGRMLLNRILKKQDVCV